MSVPQNSPKDKKGNKSPKSLKKTPAKSPKSMKKNKSPGKTPKSSKKGAMKAKATLETSMEGVTKTPNKTPGKKEQATKRKLSEEESEATSPPAKLQALVSDSGTPTTPKEDNKASKNISKQKNNNNKPQGVEINPKMFNLLFIDKNVSLTDPTTKEVLEILHDVESVSVSNSFYVECKNEKESQELQSQLQTLKLSKNFSIQPVFEKKNKDAINNILYAVGVPDITTREDIKNIFKDADLINFYNQASAWTKKCRVARITFASKEAQRAAGIKKTVKICGNNVVIVHDKSSVKRVAMHIKMKDNASTTNGKANTKTKKAVKGKKKKKEEKMEEEKEENNE